MLFKHGQWPLFEKTNGLVRPLSGTPHASATFTNTRPSTKMTEQKRSKIKRAYCNQVAGKVPRGKEGNRLRVRAFSWGGVMSQSPHDLKVLRMFIGTFHCQHTMDISFADVTVTLPSGQTALTSVSGVVKAGTFTALFGSSGSGKTTLLTTIARRFERNLTYTGTVRYDGKKWEPGMKRQIAFVPQDDVVCSYLTVREHLTFSSKLRLAVSEEERVSRVQKVIDQLRLNKCADTLLGGAMERGVSGGERKRACIANELLTEPKVLFSDEPTSGLDAALAVVVVDVLKDLSQKEGLTVMTTIHAPSSSIFAKFDDMYVLDEGRLFYRGTTGDLIPFLAGLGKQTPQFYNPADFLLEVLVLDTERKTDPRFAQAFERFSKYEGDLAMVQPTAATEISISGSSFAKRSTSIKRGSMMRNASTIFAPSFAQAEEDVYAKPFYSQTVLLTLRLWKRYKSQIFTTNETLSTLGLTLIAGLLFFQLGFGESAISSRVALTLWVVGTVMYLGTFSTAFALHDDLPVLKKDLFDGSYMLAAHMLAKQIVFIPATSFWCFIFAVIVMLASRLAFSVGNAILVILITQYAIFMFQAVGFLISAAVPASGIVVSTVVIVTYFFAFNGFFVKQSLMLPWYGWLRWPCLLTYPYQLIFYTVFPPEATFECGFPVSGYASCINGTTISGSEIVLQYDIDVPVCISVGVMIGVALILRFLAFLVYREKMRPPKGMSDSQRWWQCWKKRKTIAVKEEPTVVLPGCGGDGQKEVTALEKSVVANGEKNIKNAAEENHVVSI